MVNILSRLESLHSPHKLVARDANQSLTTQMLVDSCTELARELNERNIDVLALHGDNSTNWMVIDLIKPLSLMNEPVEGELELILERQARWARQ